MVRVVFIGLAMLLWPTQQKDRTAWDQFHDWYYNWHSFKEGSWVKVKQHIKLGTGWLNVDHTYKLEGLTKDDKGEYVTLEDLSFTESRKDKPNSKETFIARARDKKGSSKPASKFEEGDEEIKIGDTKYKCHWIKSTTKDGKDTETETAWFCDDIPGRIVKHESTLDGEVLSVESVAAFEKK